MLLDKDIGHRIQEAIDEAEAKGATKAAVMLKTEMTPMVALVRRFQAYETDTFPARSHA